MHSIHFFLPLNSVVLCIFVCTWPWVWVQSIMGNTILPSLPPSHSSSSSFHSTYDVYTCDGVPVTDQLFSRPESSSPGPVGSMPTCYQWVDTNANSTVTYRLRRVTTKAQVQLFLKCWPLIDAANTVHAYANASGSSCQACSHPWDDVILEINATTNQCAELTAVAQQHIFECWQSHYTYARTVIISVLVGLSVFLCLPGMLYYVWHQGNPCLRRCERRSSHQHLDDRSRSNSTDDHHDDNVIGIHELPVYETHAPHTYNAP